MKKISGTLVVLAAVAISASALAANSAPWPTMPLRIIVGFPQGSAPDVQARLLAKPLSGMLGQAVVVDNKPGDSGTLGALALAKATDGHTIGIVGNGQLTSAQFLSVRLPYDPNKDFSAVALVASAPLVWVAVASPEPRTTTQFIHQAQSSNWAYGSTGAGSGIQLGMEELKHALHIKARHVAFASGPLILGGLLNGQVQMALLPASLVMPMVQSGALQAIAVSTAKPTALAPALASLEDLGVRGVSIEVWNALVAPAGMPESHRSRLSAALDKILLSRDIKRAFFVQGWRVDGTSAEAVSLRIKKDTAAYQKIRDQNLLQLD